MEGKEEEKPNQTFTIDRNDFGILRSMLTELSKMIAKDLPIEQPLKLREKTKLLLNLARMHDQELYKHCLMVLELNVQDIVARISRLIVVENAE